VDQDGEFDPNRDLARNRLSTTDLGPDHIRIAGVVLEISREIRYANLDRRPPGRGLGSRRAPRRANLASR
jgi:hypothetical protein